MKQLLLLAITATSLSQGAVIWNNGAFNHADGTLSAANALGLAGISAMVYDDFELAADDTVGSAFGYFLLDSGPPLSVRYEIRQGMAPGTGGSLVASGNALSFGYLVTGILFDTLSYGPLGLSRVTIAGLNIPLPAGVYWLGLQLEFDPLASHAALLAQTSGAGAIGTPAGNNGNSFFDSPSLGSAFDPLAEDFAMGLGRLAPASTVPEPATATVAATGVLLLTLRRRRTRS